MGGLIVIIIAICQALKYAGVVTRWIPLIAIGLGLAGGLYFGGVNWVQATSGIITGLASAGLYSAYKKVIIN